MNGRTYSKNRRSKNHLLVSSGSGGKWGSA